MECPDFETLVDAVASGTAQDPGTPLYAHQQGCATCRDALAGIVQDLAFEVRLAGVERAAPLRLEIPGHAILHELRRGGQGVVFVAEQIATRRRVAIKTLARGALATPVERLRFAREVELAAALRHPGIVSVHDGGVTADQVPYLVMELVDGVDLDAWVATAAPTLERRLAVFLAVCEAVLHAHQRGVIHRDLKPSNILVQEGDHPRVLDFGLARDVRGRPDDERRVSDAPPCRGATASPRPRSAEATFDAGERPNATSSGTAASRTESRTVAEGASGSPAPQPRGASPSSGTSTSRDADPPALAAPLRRERQGPRAEESVAGRSGGEGRVSFERPPLDTGPGRGGGESAPSLPSPGVTAAGHFVGTLAYAAPEQTRGDPRDIDVRTDVYALGVILYRLLTGRPPYELAGDLPAMLATIVGTDPAPASAVASGVDRELDAIVATALAKDRERRYATVQDLIRDLRRRERHEPVEARGGGRGYVLRKFLRRHRLLAASAAVVLVAVVTAFVLVRRAAGEAERERDRALLAGREAAEIASFLREAFRSARPAVSGGALTMAAFARTALDGIDTGSFGHLGREAEAAIRATLGETLSALGDFARGAAEVGRAADALAKSPAARPEELIALRALEGRLLGSALRSDEAAQVLERAVALAREQLGSAHPTTLRAALDLAGVRVAREPARVIEDLRSLRVEIASLRAGRPDLGRQAAWLRVAALVALRDIDAVEREAAAALGDEMLFGTEAAAGPPRFLILLALGQARMEAARFAAAAATGAEVLALGETLFPPGHPELVRAHYLRGMAECSCGRVDEGARHLEIVLDGATPAPALMMELARKAAEVLRATAEHRRASAAAVLEKLLAAETRAAPGGSLEVEHARILWAIALLAEGEDEAAVSLLPQVLAGLRLREAAASPEFAEAGKTLLRALRRAELTSEADALERVIRDG